MYGGDISSQALTLKEVEFKTIYKDAGETHIVSVKIEGEDKVRPTLIYKVQADPVTRQLLHVDLRQVNLKEKIRTMIPIELVGESKAESQGAVVLPMRNDLETKQYVETPQRKRHQLMELNSQLEVKPFSWELLLAKAKLQAELYEYSEMEQTLKTLTWLYPTYDVSVLQPSNMTVAK